MATATRARRAGARAGGAAPARGRELRLAVAAKESRIGKLPVKVPPGVEYKLSGQRLSVKCAAAPPPPRPPPGPRAVAGLERSPLPPAAQPLPPGPPATTGVAAAGPGVGRPGGGPHHGRGGVPAVRLHLRGTSGADATDESAGGRWGRWSGSSRS